MDHIIVEPQSKQRLQQIAYIVRKLFLEDESDITYAFPIVRVIERLSDEEFDDTFNYIYVKDQDLPNAYANYCPQTNTMKIRESVYLGALSNNGRDRFTLAHELGHYFLHDNPASFSRSMYKPAIFRQPEWQANTFASFLLIPPFLVRDFNTPEEVKELFHVSIQAAEIALSNAKKAKR